MSLFPKVAKNTLAQVLGRAGVVLATIITTVILTRFLGTTGYGNYVFITSFILLFTAISDWGTGMISVREAAKDKKEEEKIFANALIFRLLLATASFILVNLLVRLLPQFKSLVLATGIASFLLFLHSFRTSCHIIFQTRLQFENIALTEVTISGAFLILLLWALKPTLALSLIMSLLLLANFLGTVFAFWLARRLVRFKFVLEQKIIKKILLEAMPTGALLLIFSIYNRIDIILLQTIGGPEPVGIYGLAYKVHDNLILGAAYLANAIFPILSQYAQKPEFKEKFTLIYKKTFDLLFLAGLVVLVLVLVFAPLIIAIIGGRSFSQSVIALRILALATFVAYFNHLTGYSLIALGKQKVSLIFAVLALIWNIGLNLIFIPRYSFVAAAFVTVATEGLILFLTSFYLAKRFNLFPSFSFPKTFLEIIKTRGKIF